MAQDIKSIARAIPVTVGLIAINVIVYLLSLILTGRAAYIYNIQALSVYTIQAGMWWTLITSMFMHGGIVHILCNMVSLYYLGMLIERLFGSGRFFVLYMASGIVGGLTYVAWGFLTGDIGWSVGASGAIFGLFGAYGMVLITESKHPMLFPQGWTKKALSSFLGLLAVNLLISLSPGIAWQAHVGGLIAGAIIGEIMYLGLRKRRMGA